MSVESHAVGLPTDIRGKVFTSFGRRIIEKVQIVKNASCYLVGILNYRNFH